jgi:transposase
MAEPTSDSDLRASFARVVEELSEARLENKYLREKIQRLLQERFGAQSEELDRAQLLLMLGGVDPGKSSEPVAAEAPRRSQDRLPPRKRQPRTPDNLPIVEEVIVPEPVKACPEAWRQIGEEVTELLDFEPARFFKRRIVRPKFARRDHPYAAPIVAPLQTVQDRCVAAPGLVAAVVVGKYCDHLPLYRQEQIFASRHDVHLPRQTMAQWMALAADWLKPVYEHMRQEVLAGGYVQIDETPIEYLSPGHGETKLGYLWTCARPGGDTIFHWQTSRAAKCLEAVLPASWSGVVQCDGYTAYPAFLRQRDSTSPITLAGCWAHARRAIFQAQESAPRTCAWLLNQIGQLYGIERELRASRAGPALREAVRSWQSAPILQRIQAALIKLRSRFLPQSAMGKAVAYILGQWPALERFLADGRIEIDNNGVENAIRPTAIGKKNWLFVGAANAGERGAILYTIVESCRRRGIDPLAYLREALTRLPRMTNRQIPEITPAAWANRQSPAQHSRAA